MRVPGDGLREQAALIEAYVARRCANEPRDGVAFHILRHVETHQLNAHHAGKLANHHAALGEAYAEAGALDPAIAQYRTALMLGPAFQDLRLRMGRLLLEAGRTLEARETLGEVLQARPGSVEAKVT